ncbi:MAG: RidA family protein [Devosiaceae bacterium]|nr:RidA family protein [Devosiaceae bacterium MH13]
MTRKLISSGSPMEKEAGYSRAVIDGAYVHVSGTTGFDYASMTMPAGIEAQTRNTLATIAKVLTEAGSDITETVRVRYYVTDRAHASAVMRIAGETFGAVRPAATLVVCGLLTEEMLVEIEATATLPKS